MLQRNIIFELSSRAASKEIDSQSRVDDPITETPKVHGPKMGVETLRQTI